MNSCELSDHLTSNKPFHLGADSYPDRAPRVLKPLRDRDILLKTQEIVDEYLTIFRVGSPH